MSSINMMMALRNCIRIANENLQDSCGSVDVQYGPINSGQGAKCMHFMRQTCP